MIVNIIKSIKSDNEIEFHLGDDIHFILCRNDKEYICYGVIADIDSIGFLINDVELDSMNLAEQLFIKFHEVKDGIIHKTDHNWC